MMRIPPVVLPTAALIGLVVGVAGIAMNWTEIAPVALFVFIFCTILASMQIWLVTVPPYTSPVTIPMSDATSGHTPSHNNTARVYEVQDADGDTPNTMDETRQ